MKLNQLSTVVDFGSYKDLEIEDFSFFSMMVIRMIEDTATVTYTLAKEKGADEIKEGLMQDTLRRLGQGALLPFAGTSEVAFVFSPFVPAYARIPVPYTNEAIVLFSKFLNYHLIEMLRDAAARAANEGLNTIKLRHILPWCEKWPWPLNRWC